MVVEYDTEADAFYARVTEQLVARTVEVSAFVAVDVGAGDRVVGLELLCLPAAVSSEERTLLEGQYAAAMGALVEVERLTRLSA